MTFPPRRFPAAGAAALLAALLLPAAPAAASQTIEKPQVLASVSGTTGFQSTGVEVAGDTAGRALAMWTEDRNGDFEPSLAATGVGSRWQRTAVPGAVTGIGATTSVRVALLDF